MNGFAVATIFSAVDKFSPVLASAEGNVAAFSSGTASAFGKMQAGAERFAVGAKAALQSVIPEASRLGDVIKGVAIGNLLSKGLTMAVGAIRSNFSSAVTYASNLIEVQNIVHTVFGSAEKDINAFAKSAGKSFGLTELQAKQFTGTLGSLFSGMGIKGDLSVEMSTNLAGLAGDLASFYNLTQEEAFAKIKSGMMGQAKPLQDIGIDVSVKNMEAFAQAQGKIWKDLDRTSQAMMRYQFIMERTSLAQGDYQKPIESWAVSSRNLTNAISEMAGKLAVGLMPTLIKGADLITGVVQRVSAWADANRKLIASKLEVWFNGALSIGKTLYSLLTKFGPAILTAVVAIKAFGVAVAVYKGVTVAGQAYNAMLAVQKGVTTLTAIEQQKLNLAMKANVFGLVIALVIAAVAAFMQLAQKVGGVKNAFIVVGQTAMKFVLTPFNLILDLVQLLMPLFAQAGAVLGGAFTAAGQTVMKWALTPFNLILDAIQFLLPAAARVGVVLPEAFRAVGQTIMKVLLTPINLVIEGIKGILTIASKLPGVGNIAKDALSAIGDFQSGMNVLMTGSDSTLFNSGLNAFADPTRAAQAGLAEKVQAAEAAAVGNAAGIQAFQNKVNVTLTGSESTIATDGLRALLDPARDAAAAMPERVAQAGASAARNVEGIQGFQDKMNITLTGSASTLASDGLGAYTDPYRTAREAELERQRAAGGEDEDEDPMAETNALLRELNGKMDDEIEATNGLADSGPSKSPALRWKDMGGDFWETARFGL